MESERQTVPMHRFLEWGLVALCAVSLLVYLLQSQAAAKYMALYVSSLAKFAVLLGR